MKIKPISIILPEGKFNTEVIQFDSSDISTLKKMIKLWTDLSNCLKDFGARRVNIPEGISESLFCIAMAKVKHDIVRVTKGISGANTSFDCYNTKTNKRIQVKACSVDEDLSSFGPKSIFDEIYLVYLPKLNKNGEITIYEILPKRIYKHKVNKNQTLEEQQAQGKRPRFSIYKDIILKDDLKPIYTGNINEW